MSAVRGTVGGWKHVWGADLSQLDLWLPHVSCEGYCRWGGGWGGWYGVKGNSVLSNTLKQSYESQKVLAKCANFTTSLAHFLQNVYSRCSENPTVLSCNLIQLSLFMRMFVYILKGALYVFYCNWGVPKILHINEHSISDIHVISL